MTNKTEADIRAERNTTTSKRNSVVSKGISLISFGLIALLITLDIVTWNRLLEILFLYWPLFIVAAGLRLVLKSLPLGEVTSILLDIAISVGFIALLVHPSVPSINNSLYELSGKQIDLSPDSKHVDKREGTETYNYDISIGGSEFTFRDNEAIYAFYAESNAGPVNIEESYNEFKKSHTITFDNSIEQSIVRTPFSFKNRRYELYSAITDQASYSLSVGASSGDIDLLNTPIDTFNVDLGAGEITTTFNEISTPNKISANVGAGSLKIGRAHV